MSPRAQLLRAAAQLVGSAAVEGSELTVLITVNGAKLQLRATQEEMAELAAPSLTPMEEAVLQVLGEATEPLQGAAVAERAGYAPGGHFREALARLAKLGLVEHRRGCGYVPGHARGHATGDQDMRQGNHADVDPRNV